MSREKLATVIARFLALGLRDPAPADAVASLEGSLGIKFPEDFKTVAGVYSGGMLGGISHYAIQHGGPAENILDRTLEMRRTISLPSWLIPLAEPPESMIVMNTSKGLDNTPVTWCHQGDIGNIIRSLSLTNEFDQWITYGEFFRSLVDREEEEREPC